MQCEKFCSLNRNPDNGEFTLTVTDTETETKTKTDTMGAELNGNLCWRFVSAQRDHLHTMLHKPIFTARKRSFGQGNKFTGVCLSTRGGGWVSQHALQVT